MLGHSNFDLLLSTLFSSPSVVCHPRRTKIERKKVKKQNGLHFVIVGSDPTGLMSGHHVQLCSALLCRGGSNAAQSSGRKTRAHSGRKQLAIRIQKE